MADFPVLSMSDWELLPPVNLSQKDSFLRRPHTHVPAIVSSIDSEPPHVQKDSCSSAGINFPNWAIFNFRGLQALP
jgi:hypothetical protein